ncbi:protein DBF4 homolog A [Polymixia lowei]
MKRRRVQKHSTSGLQGKVDSGDKSTLRVSYHTSVKPFVGKVFYLDLPSSKQAEALENDIKQLGGTVEKFFSKEIKYLVSNKREARYVERLKHHSAVPGSDSGQSSPHPGSNQHQPGSNRDRLKAPSQVQTDSVVTSRGKSLVERVVKEQERIQMNKTLSKALEWGVKVLYLGDVMTYIDKRKKKNVTNQCVVPSVPVKTSAKAESKGRPGLAKFKDKRIAAPFVKVEDSSRHYRPVYLAMPKMPEMNLKTASPCSPFSVEDKDHPGKKHGGHSEERGHGRSKRKGDKKRVGFCECCMLQYDNIIKHVQSERHMAFSRSDEYHVLDRLVSTLQCNFAHIKTKASRSKCSISSILLAPGLYDNTKQRHVVDVDTAEKKGEQRSTSASAGCREQSPGHFLKCNSVPGSALIGHGEADRRNRGHVSVQPQRCCRQDSLIVLAHRCDQGQMLRPKVEAAPSRGDSCTCYPTMLSRVTEANPEGHTSPVNNGSTSHSHKDLQNKFPSDSLIVTSSRHEVSVEIQDSSLECIRDGQVPLGEMTVVPDCEGGNLSSKSHSPVRAIQRRVKVYKRKRRKVDTQLTSQRNTKPSDIPNNSILKVWQLFQSSEDMDLEFCGFED